MTTLTATPSTTTVSTSSAAGLQREQGRVVGAAEGPTLIVVAGIHGNEPAGLEGAARVMARLAMGDIPLRGELLVLRGNMRALAQGARYLERDLNRGWNAAAVEQLRAKNAAGAALVAEDAEQLELLGAIDDAVLRQQGARARDRDPKNEAGQRVVLADCHTSSAPGVPFVLFGSAPHQRDFVKAFPIPVISGIVEKVEGVLSEFVSATRDVVTFCVEGGQHDAPASRDALEAVIWLCLAQAGCIDGKDANTPAGREVVRATRVLDAMRGDLPRMVDVVARHAITAADQFVMERGFRNVDRIGKGQLLARDCRGEVRADEDGVVVLPLYQKLGNDGFFWGREVRAD